MDVEEFRVQIQRELDQLTPKQRVRFAWHCVVRSLPFLAVSNEFSYWVPTKRKRHLQAVFFALDKAKGVASYTDAYAIAAAAYAAADDAYAAAAADDAYAAYAAASASAAIADAASHVYSTDAAYAAAASDATLYTKTLLPLKHFDFQTLLLNDVSKIGTGEALTIDAKDYGPLVDRLIDFLEKEGAWHLAELCDGLFYHNFYVDEEALKQRISIPAEDRAQGVAYVGKLLKQLQDGGEQLNESRIIILGDKGAGKTCLARKLVDIDAKPTKENESTPGVDTLLWKPEGTNQNIRIWDFAGHVVTHAAHRFFMSSRCLYVVVYNGRTEGANNFEYWLDHIQTYGGDSEIVLLVNEFDAHPTEVPINRLEEKYKIIYNDSFSVIDNRKAMESFTSKIVEHIQSNPAWNNERIPKSHYQVKKELEDLFRTKDGNINNERIPKEKFSAIAEKAGIDYQEELLRSLHDLGVSLWYEDLTAYNTLVLNPEWISAGVYQIINWANKDEREQKFKLDFDEFPSVFAENLQRFPAEEHRFLFDLMIHYQIAYSTNNESTLIIPHLLPNDQPKKLPDFPIDGSLMIRYRSDQQLPLHNISRFIVRHKDQIKKRYNKEVFWRYGVVLQEGEKTIALVKEDDRTITVSAKGPQRSKLIAEIRDSLNALFREYKSELPELYYKLEEPVSESYFTNEPAFIRDKHAYSLEKLKEPYLNPDTGKRTPIIFTINYYQINGENILAGGQGNKIFRDHAISNSFNFENCNIDLQGNLNELADLLSDKGKEEESKRLIQAVQALQKAEEIGDKKEIKRKGLMNKVKRILNDLENKNSSLHKSIKGVKEGVSIAQDLAEGYNKVAEWAGLPKVPKPFLKKKK